MMDPHFLQAEVTTYILSTPFPTWAVSQPVQNEPGDGKDGHIYVPKSLLRLLLPREEFGIRFNHGTIFQPTRT